MGTVFATYSVLLERVASMINRYLVFHRGKLIEETATISYANLKDIPDKSWVYYPTTRVWYRVTNTHNSVKNKAVPLNRVPKKLRMMVLVLNH